MQSMLPTVIGVSALASPSYTRQEADTGDVHVGGGPNGFLEHTPEDVVLNDTNSSLKRGLLPQASVSSMAWRLWLLLGLGAGAIKVMGWPDTTWGLPSATCHPLMLLRVSLIMSRTEPGMPVMVGVI
ncbi:MAG: hypothetical protein K2W85_11135 [Phycisphaerales bacterium]|nr:hypothetical protein [Phycisphaerales bacterium]